MRKDKQQRDFQFDLERLAMTRQVDTNQRMFTQQTFDVSKDTQLTNKALEADRKQREKEARDAEIAQDKRELQWTNDTELRFNSNKSLKDKYLK